MPKKGNPTASDSNFREPRPSPRIQLFKEDRHDLFKILSGVLQPGTTGMYDAEV